jgi:hypothetical protein
MHPTFLAGRALTSSDGAVACSKYNTLLPKPKNGMEHGNKPRFYVSRMFGAHAIFEQY